MPYFRSCLVLALALAWSSIALAQVAEDVPTPDDTEGPAPEVDEVDHVPDLGVPESTEPSATEPTESTESVEEPTIPADDGPLPEGQGFAEDLDSAEWSSEFFGYVRLSYENVSNDPNFEFVGRNDGFLINNARLGVRGGFKPAALSYQVSIEGAADLRSELNTPESEIDVRLRDAFVRWDAAPWLGVQVGQFKAPFAAEDLRSTASLAFASRAVGHEGVPVGRGFEESGVALDRQVGVMLNNPESITFGDLALGYGAMIFSGNGLNQALDDNGRPALVGRLELSYGGFVTLGGAASWNPRTEGPLPDSLDETDVAFAADLAVEVAALTVRGQFVQATTSFDTVGTQDRTRRAFHGEAGYRFSMLPVPFVLAYRYAFYDPWAGASSDSGGIDPSSFALQYHTIGLRAFHPDERVGLSAYVNYTLTVEKDARELDNNLLQVLLQLVY